MARALSHDIMYLSRPMLQIYCDGPYDQSKDNIGVSFLIEPRFLPKLNATRKTGIEIPPAGAFGLE